MEDKEALIQQSSNYKDGRDQHKFKTKYVSPANSNELKRVRITPPGGN